MAFITAETRSDLIELSVAMLKQAPSAALLEELIALSVGGGSLADAADHIAKTDAFKAEYPSFQTAEQYAAEIFDNITTGGTVTADIRTAVIELATGMLTSGSVTKAGLALAIAEYLAAPAALLNTDFADIAQSFQNRADAAEYFVVDKELGGSTDAELAAAIASVTSDAATLTAANTAADATASAEVVVAGQTITLTTGLDTGSSFTGASTDDTFTAQETGTATTDTLTTGDNLKGGAGTDTLSIAVSGTIVGGQTSGVVTSSIEAISVFNNSTAAYEVDAALMPGVTNVYVNGGANATTFDDLDTLANLHLISTNVNATVSTTALAVAGTADEAIILSNGAAQAAAMTATYDGLEVINFNAAGTTGSATLSLTLASTELEKIVVTGDADANLTAIFAGADLDTQTAVFDASAAGGVIRASITKGDSENAAVTMSAQSDTLTFVGALSENTVLVGGDGTDTLILDTNVDFDEDETTQTGSGVSGFEVLRLASGTEVDELSLTNNAGITSVVALGAGSYTNATALATLTQGVTGAFETDLATDGTADALTVALVSSVSGGGAVTSTLTAPDVEALTVSSTGTAANVLTMDDDGSLDLTSITASGTVGLTLNIGGAALATVDASGVTGTANAFVLDASASEADMTVTAATVRPADADAGTANTITTGSGDDTITGGEYKDVISAGAGDDTITGGDGDNNLTGGAGDDTITGGADDDTISDGAGDDTVVGGAGVDTITMGAGSDDIDAGAGKDVIAAGVNLSSGDDIDGGADADTLSATLSGVGVAPTIANVETLAVSFGASTFLDMESVTGVTALIVDGAAGGTSAQIKNLVTGTTVTATDDASLAGVVGNLSNLTIDTADDATLGIKIAANDNAATPAASALGNITVTDAVSVAVTNEGGTADNVLSHSITALALDDAETTSLSITASEFGGLSMGTAGVTGTSELKSFTLAAESAVVIGASTVAVGAGVQDGVAISDAAELQTISVSATGSSATVDLGEIGAVASTALTDITLAASEGGTISAEEITASANLSSVSITADGTNSDVTLLDAITTTQGGISQVTITASDRGNVDMALGDLVVDGAGALGGLISGLAVSASGRGTVNLAGFTANSTASGTAGAYSLTTSDRGTITMDAATSISTDGALTSLTVAVGEDSTLTAVDGLITAAGTITDTVISVGADATTTGILTIGEVGTVHTDAIVTLDADASNGADINLIGATFTALDIVLGGTGAIAVEVNPDRDGDDSDDFSAIEVDYDGNASAIDIFNNAAADPAITALVINVSGSTNTNTINTSIASKLTYTGGSGADTVGGTAGKDTISTGAGNDVIGGAGRTETIVIGSNTNTHTFISTINGEANTVTADGALTTAQLAAALAVLINDDYATTKAIATVTDSTVTVTYGAFDGVAGATTGTGTSTDAVTVGFGAGDDTVSAGVGNDTIFMGSGEDSITTGTGSDDVHVLGLATGNTGLSTAASASTFAGAAIANGDSITFGNGVDIITDFTSGTDDLVVSAATTVFEGKAPTTLIGATAADLAEDTIHGARGNFVSSTGAFTFSATGTDFLLAINDGTAADDSLATNTNVMILTGVTALVAGDFI